MFLQPHQEHSSVALHNHLHFAVRRFQAIFRENKTPVFQLLTARFTLFFFFQSEILCFSGTCLWFSVMSWTFSTFSVHRETLSHHVLIPNGRQRNLLWSKDVDLDPQFSIELLTNNKRVCDGSTILGARSLFPFCSVLFWISLSVTGILFVGGLIFFLQCSFPQGDRCPHRYHHHSLTSLISSHILVFPTCRVWFYVLFHHN